MTAAVDTPPLPRYADASGDAGWEFGWGSVLVIRGDQESLTVTVDLDSNYHDTGLSTTMGRQLAAAVQAACHAADGKPLGWIQYRAESAPPGPTDPARPGMWKVGDGHWEGLSHLTETFDAATVDSFAASQRAAGRIVTVYTRTFQTLTQATEWVKVPDPTAIVCHDGGAS